MSATRYGNGDSVSFEAAYKNALDNPDVRVENEPARKPQRTQTGRKAAKDTNALARKFEALWQAHGGPVLDAEVRFHPTRRWRLDYCHLGTKIAIELEGGVWSNGRHNRAKGFIGDCEKYNSAAEVGYTVFRLASPMVTAEWVQRIIAHIRSIEASRP